MSSSWVTTTLLLDQLHDADGAAWNTFVQRFRGPLYSLTRKMGLPADETEDTVQEILLSFVRAYRDDRYDRSKGRLHQWLFSIARHRILDALRKKQRQDGPLDPAGGRTSFWSSVPGEEEAQEVFEQAWQETVYHSCLERLRQELRPQTVQAFEMVTVQSRTPAEVAEELGMTRNAVFIAKHRALTRLRELTREFEDVE